MRRALSRIARVCVLLAPLSAGVVCASPNSWPSTTFIAPHERGEYVARDARTNEELWRTHWLVERLNAHGGGTLFRVREDGSGRRGRPEGTRWTVSMELDVSRGGESFSAVREVRDLSDRLLESQRRALSSKTGTGTVTTVDYDKHTERSVSFAVDETSIPVELLPMQLRGLSDAPDQRLRFHLITRDGKTVPMEARIVGQETVRTPAGEFLSYKTELTVTGVIGLIGRLLLPTMYIWHRVDPPHAWVRYQGLDGGIGSPEVIMELARFEMTSADDSRAAEPGDRGRSSSNEIPAPR